jgi:hypothetical protein
VLLLEEQYELGRLWFRVKRRDRTTSSGTYTLSPVAAGRPFLLVARGWISSAGKQRRFLSNAGEIEGAARLELTSGEERHGVDIRFGDEKAFCISSAAEALEPVLFELRERIPFLPVGLGAGDKFGSVSTTSAPAGGSFRMCGIPRGSYRLAATATGRFAVEDVVIIDRDVTGLSMKLEPGSALNVNVEIEAQERVPAPKKIHVSVEDVSRYRGFSFGPSDWISIPAAFAPRPCLRVTTVLRLSGLTEGCNVKEGRPDGERLVSI